MILSRSMLIKSYIITLHATLAAKFKLLRRLQLLESVVLIS